MMTDRTKTPQKIFLQENYGKQEYGIKQDGNIRGMVRYFRCDDDYNKIKRVLAMAMIDYLDNNKPEGKMCLSSGECANIDNAFAFGDWDMIFRYIEKYIKKLLMRLIDKDALVAEIERRTDELYDLLPDASKVENGSITTSEACNTGKYTALESFRDYINTLEVKEVDLEKELDSMITPELKLHKALPSLFDVAKHFFELGLRNTITEEDCKLIWNIGDEIPYMPEEEFFKELLKRYKVQKGE